MSAPSRQAWHVETVAIASGRDERPGAPLNVPPTLASTYRDGGEYGYGRWDNPTWRAFEGSLGALEGGMALAFSCGQAAIASLIARLPIGATVLMPVDAYLGTRALVDELAAQGRLHVAKVQMADTAAALRELADADLLWAESPTNPTLAIVDLETLLGAARDRGIPAVVDNTFATPLLQRPLDYGATAVVHSATKYLGGHSDLLLGAVITREESVLEQLRTHRTLHGAIPGPLEAFLALRGMRTLAVRLERAERTAQTLAEALQDHPLVDVVHYPGLPHDRGHGVAKRQMAGFGAMLSFVVANAEVADEIVGALRLIVGGTSLGGVETTIDRRNRWTGEEEVAPGLLRLSVGLEHPADVWADLDQAMKSVAANA